MKDEEIMYQNIKDILIQSAETYGNEDAIRYKSGRNEITAKSYQQLKQDSEGLSNAIDALDEHGQHIAIIGATSYEWIVSYFGVVGGANVAVPLDVSLPALEVCDLLNRADVTMLIYDEIRKDVAELVREKCPGVHCMVAMQEIQDATEIATLVKKGSIEELEQVHSVSQPDSASEDEKQVRDLKTYSLHQLISTYTGENKNNPSSDSLCTIMFTSGTTGKSKGVMLTHRNLTDNATSLDMKLKPRTTILSVLPIHHAYCLSMDIIKGISIGSIICINDSLLRLAKNMKLFQPDMILMVPMMIESLAKKLEGFVDISKEAVQEIFGKNLHTICSGGAYLNPAMLTLFQKYGITILQGYGMTECAPVISTNLPWLIKETSVGKLMPNCIAKTEDEELLVKGSSVMMGYYKMPEETKEALTEDGWLRTGDLGYADEDGYIFLTGRKKNLIITKNGENVSPEEIENKLGEDRRVQEILVRENAGVIEAEIFPDYESCEKEGITDVKGVFQQLIDEYNKNAPAHKRIYSLIIRKEEFEKTTSKKIKRF